MVFTQLRIVIGLLLSAVVGLQDSSRTIRVEGIVVDASTGAPIFQASVGVQPGVTRAQTDKQGGFGFDIKLPTCTATTTNQADVAQCGPTRIYVKKVGYTDLRPEGTSIPHNHGIPLAIPDNGPARVVARLRPSTSVSGQVLNSLGQPISGVAIVPFRVIFNEAGTLYRREYTTLPAVVTDPEGRFFFSNRSALSPGSYSFELDAVSPLPTVQQPLTANPAIIRFTEPATITSIFYPGVTEERAAAAVVVAGSDLSLGSIVMPPSPTAKLTIRLINETPHLLNGPGTIMIRRAGSARSIHLFNFRNGSEQMIVGQLGAGLYEVAINFSDPGRAGRGRVVINMGIGDTEAMVRIKTDVRAKVGGRVFLEDSVGGSAEVRLGLFPLSATYDQVVGMWNPSAVVLRSQADGSFAPSQTAPGTYRVAIIEAPIGRAVTSIRSNQTLLASNILEVDEKVDFEVGLGEGGTVLGTVQGLDASLQNIVVAVPQDSLVSPIRTVFPTADGRFQLTLSAGSYRIFAWGELEGAPYYDSSFLASYESRSLLVNVAKNRESTVTLNIRE